MFSSVHTVTRALQTEVDGALGTTRPAPAWCQHTGPEAAETLLGGQVFMVSGQQSLDLISEPTSPTSRVTSTSASRVGARVAAEAVTNSANVGTH